MTNEISLNVTVRISVRKDPYRADREHVSWMWHLDLVRPRTMPPLALASGYACDSEERAYSEALNAAHDLCLPTVNA